MTKLCISLVSMPPSAVPAIVRQPHGDGGPPAGDLRGGESQRAIGRNRGRRREERRIIHLDQELQRLRGFIRGTRSDRARPSGDRFGRCALHHGLIRAHGENRRVVDWSRR
jgi:hypothetical protein